MGSEAFAHLALHHHEHALDGRYVIEHVAHERRGDVVRQVGHEHQRPGRRRSVCQSRRMASASTTVTPGRSCSDLAQRRRETAVDFDGDHVRAGLGQREGQRAEPGPDLDHVIARPDTGEGGDAPHGVGVGDEVLAEVTPRCQAAGGEQVADRRPGVGHEDWRISTWIGADVRSAICWNLDAASTSVRVSPPDHGRVVHRIERPLATLTTVTSCPPPIPL